MSAKLVIAHRGASAHAPENTLPAYDLAVRQGADCIELDLHASKDGILVCLHDRTLERTTNVRDIFPDRGRDVADTAGARRQWFVHDFSLAEIQMLDCGSWFGEAHTGARIQTFDDILDWARGRTSVLAELKYPEAYEPIGVDLLSLFDGVVRRHGLPGDADLAVSVQSFHEPTVRRAGALYHRQLSVGFLRQSADSVACADAERLATIATFATAIGPEKDSLEERPELVTQAHAAGLRVTPWTFRASSPGRFENVRAEMTYYLERLDVDAVITDNPDQAPPRTGTDDE
jgi:glycerophosphoryl diester phosphodiesterase